MTHRTTTGRALRVLDGGKSSPTPSAPAAARKAA